MIFSALIFIICYVLIITERFPNPIIAMVGGGLLIFTRILTQDEAVSFIDFNTIGLLCGMMIIVAILKRTGLIEYIAVKAIKRTKGNPWRILVIFSVLTAVLSALLDNVTTVLIIVPITIAVADVLRISSIPFLISEILFSNIGGTATLIGDPPNILIGNSSKIGFVDFIVHNAPIAMIVGVFSLFLLKLIYHRQFQVIIDAAILDSFKEDRIIKSKKIAFRSILVFIFVIVGFLLHDIIHIDLAAIALSGGFVLVLITRTNLENVLKEVEWQTLFFFMGLFILVGGLEKTGLIDFIAHKTMSLSSDPLILTQFILWGSALASTIIDNVPFTATMIPLIKSIQEISSHNLHTLWWALSLGACFGGNGTIVGAAANIIVVGIASKNRTPIRFLEFLYVGFPLMLFSILLSAIYIHIIHFIWKF